MVFSLYGQKQIKNNQKIAHEIYSIFLITVSGFYTPEVAGVRLSWEE